MPGAGRTHILVAPEFPPQTGGIQTALLNVARGLADEGIHIVGPRCPGDAEFDATLSWPVTRVPLDPELRGLHLPLGRRIGWLPAVSAKYATRLVPTLVRLVRRSPEPPWLHCGTIHGLLACSTAARMTGARTCAYLYGMELPFPDAGEVGRGMRLAIGDPLRRADAVLPISEHTARAAVAWRGGREGLTVIHLGVDHQRFRPRDASALRRRHGLSDRLVILTVGRLVARKGHDVMLRALPAILEQVPTAHYVVCGTGPERDRLARVASGLGLDDHVSFIGAVDGDNLPLWYAACDVFAMICREIPERNDVEGFGLVFLEAAACGKPTIAGNSGGAPEAVVDGETGIVVDPHSPEAVARAATALLTDTDLRRTMGRAGRVHVERAGTWTHTIETVRQALARAAGDPQI